MYKVISQHWSFSTCKFGSKVKHKCCLLFYKEGMMGLHLTSPPPQYVPFKPIIFAYYLLPFLFHYSCIARLLKKGFSHNIQSDNQQRGGNSTTGIKLLGIVSCLCYKFRYNANLLLTLSWCWLLCQEQRYINRCPCCYLVKCLLEAAPDIV